jgi:hypothetical protein
VTFAKSVHLEWEKVMHPFRLLSLCAASAGTLLGLLAFSPVHAQKLVTKDAKVLKREIVVKKDTKAACRLVEAVLGCEKLYLIDYEDSLLQVQVSVVTADGNSYTGQPPFIFSLPTDYPEIRLLRLSSSMAPKVEYQFQDASKSSGLRYVFIPKVLSPPPPPIDSKFIKCPESQPTVGMVGPLDSPRIALPLLNRKISYLTTSFGALAAGTFAWYLVEKKNGDDEFAKYQAATRTEDAVAFRIKTDKACSRRDVAGYVSIGSGVVFAVLLVRDLMRSKPPESDSQQQFPSPETVTKKVGFKLNSNPQTYALAIGVQVNF